MILFPAIDLLEGRCVRLIQGRREDCRTYSDRPEEVARRWAGAGAKWLHVVDLEGALDGKFLANGRAIEAIRSAVDLKIEMGGGIRTADQAARCLEMGVDRAIVSTAAFESPDFAGEAFARFGDRLAVSLDSKDGMAATRGWLKSSGVETLEAVRRLHAMGARALVVTDVKRDGMMTEPNFDMVRDVADEAPLQVIASGGFSKMEQLDRLAALNRPNILGAILGKSLYEGSIDLKEAIARFPQGEGAA